MSAADSREIRVFVSSTFRDMQAERDELVKHIFPKLRKLCEDRGVVWGEVDLRWGINDEQKAEGRVLPICLEEIERCRPYFIGLLGERYGWVPEHIERDLLDSHEWLREHLDHSVTELEIEHGVLRKPEMGNRALFYFRDPAYIERMPEGEREAFREMPGSDAARNLEMLKRRICQSGLALKVNYADPKQLGEWVLRDLTIAINQKYPEDEKRDPLDLEAAEHESTARRLSGVYIGRKEYFDRLDAHAAGGGPPLIVLGESGVGKSALLANWALRYREAHAHTALILHFIGSSPYSADWQGMLRRVMGELKRRFNIADDIPASADALRDALPMWFAMTAAQGRCVIVLDALNQLEDRDAAPDLGWLPRDVPANIRLIVSTLPGRPLDALKKRGWPKGTVKPMSVEERKRLIVEYLDQFRKRPTAAQIERIANDPETANPLYLKAILEEIRVFGVYEELDARIDHYLETTTIPDLYRRILKRYEQDYERDRPGLVRDAMRHLWAARRGLSESELLDLLGTDGNPMPQAYWSPISLAANQSIVNRSGLLGFGHDYLRQAVQEEYLPADEDHNRAHVTLADYFDQRELGPRKVDELPWLLAQAGADYHERLKNCLTDLDMFMELREERHKADLHAYWLQLGDAYDMADEYRAALDRFETSVGISPPLAGRLNEVAFFLHDCAKHNTAEVLYRRLHDIDLALYGSASAQVATTLNNLASLLLDTNRHPEAESLFRLALEIDTAIYGPKHSVVARRLHNLAVLLRKTGRREEAQQKCRQALEIREAVHGSQHPVVATSLVSMANLMRDANRPADAEALFRRALEIDEAAFGPSHPNVAADVQELSGLLRERNSYGEAKYFARKALHICEESFGPTHPRVASALNNLAVLLRETNHHSEAESNCRRALEISESQFGDHHPEVAASLHNLALVLKDTNQFQEAESHCRRALDIHQLSFGPAHPSVAATLDNLAGLYQAQERYDEAEESSRRSLRINEISFGPSHPSVATNLNNLGVITREMHRYDEARDLFRRALRIDQRSLGSHHPNVARDLYNLASVLQASKDFSKAESLYRRALDIDETSFGSLHPNVALDLNGLAESLKATDRTEEAAVASLRAVEILLDFTRCNGREHARLRSTLRTYSAILQSTGLAAPEIRAGVAALLDKYGAPPLDLLLGNA